MGHLHLLPCDHRRHVSCFYVPYVYMFHVSTCPTCPTCTCFMFLRVLRGHVSCFCVLYKYMFHVSTCPTWTCFIFLRALHVHVSTWSTFICFICLRALHISAAGFYVPYMYLPAYAITGGVSRTNAAYLLSIIGVFSTLARVITGWVSDRPWADCFMITNMALIIGGVSTMLCPFCTTFALRALYSVIYGMSTGRLLDSAVSLT